MNAKLDEVVRMSREAMPPAGASWSFTLYDQANGDFVPNDRKKYILGKNGGMKLDAEGGIEIHVAAKLPDGVPPENRLPIERKDEDIGLILRIHVPDLDVMRSGGPLLAGPLDLVQGGQGLIFRVPVFLDDDEYRGMISTVIDVESLWREVEAAGFDLDEVWIRGVDGSGGDGAPFHGAASEPPLAADDEECVTAEVQNGRVPGPRVAGGGSASL